MAHHIAAEPESFDWVFAVQGDVVTRLSVDRVSEDDLRPHLVPGTIYRILALTRQPRASLTVSCTLDPNSGAVTHVPDESQRPSLTSSADRDLVFACLTDENEAIGLESHYWTLSDYLARAMPTWPTVEAAESALRKCLRTDLHGIAADPATERYLYLQEMWRAGSLTAVLPQPYSEIFAAWPRHYRDIGHPMPPELVATIIVLAALVAYGVPSMGIAACACALVLIGIDKLKWSRHRNRALEVVMGSKVLMQFLHERRALSLQQAKTRSR